MSFYSGDIDQRPLRSAAKGDKEAYTTFTQLGGRLVALDEVRAHLSELPLDLVLGVLARISAHYVREGRHFFGVDAQGPYLNYALADDFPEPLRGAAVMYAPGRVPLTGGRHTFIHEHGLAALSQMAIHHCHNRSMTADLTLPDFGRVARLLLILNDHLSTSSTGEDVTLVVRRRVAADILYCSQFNNVGGFWSALVQLARCDAILSTYLPRYYASAGEEFTRRAGIGVREYLLAAAILLDVAMELPKRVTLRQSPWLTADSITASVTQNRDEVRRVLVAACQTPGDLHRSRPERGESDIFEFADLQRRPLVEVRPGELISPTWSLFLRQLLSFPFQVLAESPAGLTALGAAYEDYAHDTAARVAGKDLNGAWTALKGQPVQGGEIDSVMWRDGIAIIFEHKSKNLMLNLGDRRSVRNALGPADRELEDLATRLPSDKSALTHGLWQFARISRTSDLFFKSRFGALPRRVIPIITTLEHFHVSDWVRKIYLEPLVTAAGVPNPPGWAPTEWLHISDLEALAQLAEDGELDLAALLDAKASTPERFEWFLMKRFGNVRIDRHLLGRGKVLFRQAQVRYFGDDTERSTPDEPAS